MTVAGAITASLQHTASLSVGGGVEKEANDNARRTVCSVIHLSRK